MTGRRGLVTAVALCLVGAALVLLAVSRTWVSYRLGGTPPLPSRRLDVSGARLAPGARVLGLVGLTGVAAVPATRRFGRTVVGALVAAAGAGVVAVLARVLADPMAAVRRSDAAVDARSADLGAWPYVAVTGGLLLLMAGVLVAVRGRRWQELSGRYDAPTEQPRAESSLWEALDRGEDPTTAGSDRGD